MIQISKKGSLFAYAFSHLCVDFACFFMLFSSFRKYAASMEMLTLGFLVYNVTAFGLQPFIGYMCDIKKRIPIALTGCCIIVAGLALIQFPWVSLLTCAVGNACFHVGGGIDSLVHSQGRMSRSGVFVSPGAVGVALGTLAGKNGGVPIVIPVILILISCLLLIFFAGQYLERTVVHFNITSLRIPSSLILALCFAVVAVRSYAGALIPLGWRTSTVLLLLPGVGACIGKAAGGILADRLGARNVGVVSLLVSIPLLCFGNQNAAFCTVGILLFNMTMPITLCAIAGKLPVNPGLAFGLTTLWLLWGNIPTFFFAMPVHFVIPVLAILILISGFFIYIVTINIKGVGFFEKASQVV